MKLNLQQKKWASKRRQGLAPRVLCSLLIKQKCKCALSGAKMIFDKRQGTPVAGGNGCHPLYASVDHKDPGNPDCQIVCYALNDLKGHLPLDCFNALKKTHAWCKLMKRWRNQVVRNRADRRAFMRLLRPNTKLKNR
jgi:hypothetical protein